MRRTIVFVLGCAAATLLPASSGLAQNGGAEVKRMTVKQCKAERSADKGAFKAAYGRTAMRTCIRRTTPEIRPERRSAVRDCRDERAEDAEAFRETYGTNANRMNAFGKCVRTKVHAEIRGDVAEFKNAAQECRAERRDDPEAFRETYGTNAPAGENARGTKRNAFGKCVRMKVRQAENGNGNGENGNGDNGNGENGNGDGENGDGDEE